MTDPQTRAAGGRVIVAGSINTDIVARVDRFPAAGETLTGRDLAFLPGGKGANQAVAAARAGARVAMIGCVGDDAFGASLRQFLAAERIDVAGIAVQAGTPTGTALILVDGAGENEIVVIPAANASLDQTLVAAARPVAGDVLVAQYETPADSTTVFFTAGRAAAAMNVLNPAPAGTVSADLLALVDVLVVNEIELATVAEMPVVPEPRLDDVQDAAEALRDRGFGGTLVTTLGARGAIAVVRGRTLEIDGCAVTAVDSTGAGDCFVGYLVGALAAGDELPAALSTANVAASLCVQRRGAARSMPAIDEVRAVT